MTARPDPSPLDAGFAALSDPTRRALVARLRQGEATVSQLLAPLRMTMTGLRKHLAVLERAGLVTTAKRGRTRHVRLQAEALQPALDFLDGYRGLAGAFDPARPYVDLSDADVT